MSEHDPYASPQAAVGEIPLAAIEVPEKITDHIRYGWIAATVSGVFTLAITLVAMAAGSRHSLFNAWNLVDVALIAGLGYGIYRKSRTAATLMFAYFLLSKILVIVETGKPNGLVLGIIFLIFYFRAMTATFRYHAFIQHARRFPPAPKKRISDDPYFNIGRQQPQDD